MKFYVVFLLKGVWFRWQGNHSTKKNDDKNYFQNQSKELSSFHVFEQKETKPKEVPKRRTEDTSLAQTWLINTLGFLNRENTS